jgi:hypothetical protein
MVRDHEVEKVVTVFDLVKAVHEIDPTIPVLIFGPYNYLGYSRSFLVTQI